MPQPTTKVIFEDMKDEIYGYFGVCQECKCSHIMNGDNYCHKCGLKIIKE